MVQNQWYHFGIGAPRISVYFSGDWDVHWGYGVLAHGQMNHSGFKSKVELEPPVLPIYSIRGNWSQMNLKTLPPRFSSRRSIFFARQNMLSGG